jgi:hypothetical protein
VYLYTQLWEPLKQYLMGGGSAHSHKYKLQFEEQFLLFMMATYEDHTKSCEHILYYSKDTCAKMDIFFFFFLRYWRCLVTVPQYSENDPRISAIAT